MSSKEQYKDALKRARQEIGELKEESGTANIKNANLHARIKDLQDIIHSHHNYDENKVKKWYQFWK